MVTVPCNAGGHCFDRRTLLCQEDIVLPGGRKTWTLPDKPQPHTLVACFHTGALKNWPQRHSNAYRCLFSVVCRSKINRVRTFVSHDDSLLCFLLRNGRKWNKTILLGA
jgi:hypothetical protein